MLRNQAQPTLTVSMRSVRISGKRGGLAQLGEHYVRNVGVAGSTPVPSTNSRSRMPDAVFDRIPAGDTFRPKDDKLWSSPHQADLRPDRPPVPNHGG